MALLILVGRRSVSHSPMPFLLPQNGSLPQEEEEEAGSKKKKQRKKKKEEAEEEQK